MSDRELPINVERAMEQIVKNVQIFESLEIVIKDLKKDYEEMSKKPQSNMEEVGMNFLKFNSKAEVCEEVLQRISDIAQKSLEDKMEKGK